MALAGFHDFIGISGDDYVIEPVGSCRPLRRPGQSGVFRNLAPTLCVAAGGGKTDGMTATLRMGYRFHMI